MRYQEFTKPLITHLYYGDPLSSGVYLPNSLYESKEGKNTHLE
jgi:hypothetical protein